MARRGLFGGMTPIAPVDPVYVSPDNLDRPYAAPADIAAFADFVTNPNGTPIAAPEPWKPNAWGTLDRVLGGMTITQARQDQQNDHDAEIARQQRQALLERVLGNDPRARLAYLTKPDAWASEVAKNYAPATVNGGDTLMRPGYGQTTAPKLEMSGDSAVVQTPEGMTVTGRRPMAASDEAELRIKEALAALKELETRGQLARWANQNAVDQGQLGLGWYNARKSGGAGGGAPTAGTPWKRSWN